MTTTDNVDLQMINGDESAAADSAGIKLGAPLMRFAQSLALRDEADLQRDRQALLASGGAEVLVDAAAVAGNFQRMVRIADAIGIPVDDMDAKLGVEIRATLDLQRFASAKNSLADADYESG